MVQAIQSVFQVARWKKRHGERAGPHPLQEISWKNYTHFDLCLIYPGLRELHSHTRFPGKQVAVCPDKVQASVIKEEGNDIGAGQGVLLTNHFRPTDGLSFNPSSVSLRWVIWGALCNPSGFQLIYKIKTMFSLTSITWHMFKELRKGQGLACRERGMHGTPLGPKAGAAKRFNPECEWGVTGLLSILETCSWLPHQAVGNLKAGISCIFTSYVSSDWHRTWYRENAQQKNIYIWWVGGIVQTKM